MPHLAQYSMALRAGKADTGTSLPRYGSIAFPVLRAKHIGNVHGERLLHGGCIPAQW